MCEGAEELVYGGYMLSSVQLQTVLNEVWSVLRRHDLTWVEISQLWDALGRVHIQRGRQARTEKLRCENASLC